MKIPTPVITLIVGLALAVSLLVSSMSAVAGKKSALAEASANAAANAGPAAPASAAASAASGNASASAASGSAPASAAGGAPASAAGGASASSSASPSVPASASASGFVIPPHANYDGQVRGDLGSIAIVVHNTFAVAYFCNGGTQEAWFNGTPHNGKLSMTGKGNASLIANYALGHARGTVVVNGISYPFSIIAVHKPSGLFESIAVVRGATVKAGWIVLANGTQVGSLNPDTNAAKQTSQAAPKLNLSTLTADDGGTTLTATPIDAETGSGF
jgi:serine/threonine-protein kinase